MDTIFGNGIEYQRLPLNTHGRSKTGWKIPVILMCCLPSLVYALVAGDPERAVAPCRASCLCGGEVVAGGRAPCLGPTCEDAAWAVVWGRPTQEARWSWASQSSSFHGPAPGHHPLCTRALTEPRGRCLAEQLGCCLAAPPLPSSATLAASLDPLPCQAMRSPPLQLGLCEAKGVYKHKAHNTAQRRQGAQEGPPPL